MGVIYIWVHPSYIFIFAGFGVGGLKLSANEELGASRIFGLGLIGGFYLSDES